MTKRYKLDRVASVDNRSPPDKNFGPKQVCLVVGKEYVAPFQMYLS